MQRNTELMERNSKKSPEKKGTTIRAISIHQIHVLLDVHQIRDTQITQFTKKEQRFTEVEAASSKAAEKELNKHYNRYVNRTAQP